MTTTTHTSSIDSFAEWALILIFLLASCILVATGSNASELKQLSILQLLSRIESDLYKDKLSGVSKSGLVPSLSVVRPKLRPNDLKKKQPVGSLGSTNTEGIRLTNTGLPLSDLKPKLRPFNTTSTQNNASIGFKDNRGSLATSRVLTAQDKEAFRQQVGDCWHLDVGSGAKNVTVILGFEMLENGKVVPSSFELVGHSGGNSADTQIAYQAARRAVLRCQKGGYKLPPEKYEQWRNVEVKFDPENIRK